MNYPKYNLGHAIVGFMNLMHSGAIMLAFLFGVIGLVCMFFSALASAILLSLAGLLLVVQIISRARHMFKIRAVRRSRSSFTLLHPKTRQRFSPDDIQSVRKKDFLHPDPWRPITLGYPGLEIQLANVEEAIEHLYPCGVEDLRDKMFTYLKEHLSADVQFEEDVAERTAPIVSSVGRRTRPRYIAPMVAIAVMVVGLAIVKGNYWLLLSLPLVFFGRARAAPNANMVAGCLPLVILAVSILAGIFVHPLWIVPGVACLVTWLVTSVWMGVSMTTLADNQDTKEDREA